MAGLLKYFQDGGLLMYPLIACSLIALAVIIERFVRLRRSALIDIGTVEEIQSLIERGDWEMAVLRHEKDSSLVGRVLAKGLDEYLNTSADIETSLVEAGERQLQVLHNNISLLGLIARIAPLLGLLGTVVGMIRGFEHLSETGVGKEQLASAIGVALITTATGLIVAIPTLVAITYFRSRVRRYQAEFEEIFIDVIKSVKASPHTPQKSQPAVVQEPVAAESTS